MAASFRYWSINITANNNAWPSIQIGEIQWRIISGGVKSNPVTVTGNKTFGANTPDLVNDGDFTTAWVTDGSLGLPARIVFDFGVDISFAEVAIAPLSGSDLTFCPKDFEIDGSEDGITWTDVKNFTGVGGYVHDVFSNFELNPPPAAGLRCSQLGIIALNSPSAAAELAVSQLAIISVIANGQSFQPLGPVVGLGCWTPCANLAYNGS